MTARSVLFFSVPKSELDNVYCDSHSVNDGIMLASGTMIGEKRALACGHGDVGPLWEPWCAERLAKSSARSVTSQLTSRRPPRHGFRVERQTLPENWECTEQMRTVPGSARQRARLPSLSQ